MRGVRTTSQRAGLVPAGATLVATTLTTGSEQPAVAWDNGVAMTPPPGWNSYDSFKPLADYIHTAGLKFGVHLMRGIPRQVVADNLPVAGTNCRANEIENSTTAAWLNLNWGLDMPNPCVQAYLDAQFTLLASWGVDYKLAIQRSGRPMVLSLSPGPTSTDNGTHVADNATMWRIVNDLWDNLPSVDALFERLHAWTPYRRPGAWPDPDMIPIGRLSQAGPVGEPRYSNLTSDEQYTLLTLWSITKSPLMGGGDLTQNRASELALMTNSAVLAVDQRSTNNRRLYGGTQEMWTADVPGSADKYVALFNRGGSTANVSVTLSDLGIGSATVTDLWSGAGLGTATRRRAQPVDCGRQRHRAVVVQRSDQPALARAGRGQRRAAGGPAQRQVPGRVRGVDHRRRTPGPMGLRHRRQPAVAAP